MLVNDSNNPRVEESQDYEILDSLREVQMPTDLPWE